MREHARRDARLLLKYILSRFVYATFFFSSSSFFFLAAFLFFSRAALARAAMFIV